MTIAGASGWYGRDRPSGTSIPTGRLNEWTAYYRRLELEEGQPFGLDLVIRGSEERLSPILMTALATGLALVPLAWAGNKPGHEIEHPMAIVILGGLVTSTVLNLVLMPSLYLAFGKAGSRAEDEEAEAGAVKSCH